MDRVVLDYFGTMTPLNQLARIAATGSQQLVVEPFDRSLLKDIEKAITMANLNLTPTNDGTGTLRYCTISHIYQVRFDYEHQLHCF